MDDTVYETGSKRRAVNVLCRYWHEQERRWPRPLIICRTSRKIDRSRYLLYLSYCRLTRKRNNIGIPKGNKH